MEREVSAPEVPVSTGGSHFDSEAILATGNQIAASAKNLGRNSLAQQNLFSLLRGKATNNVLLPFEVECLMSKPCKEFGKNS